MLIPNYIEMKFIYNFLLIAAIFFCGCQDRQQRVLKQFGLESESAVVSSYTEIPLKGKPIELTVPNTQSDALYVGCLEELFDSISVVRLETTSTFVVGEISKLEIVNDTIYILDKKTKSIFLFSKTGRGLVKLEKIGQGPGEYTEATSMSVDVNSIYVYDQWQHKVIKYAHNGSLIADYNVPFRCQSVFSLENGDMLCFGEGEHNFHLPSILNYCFWQCDSAFSHISRVGLQSDQDKTIGNGNNALWHYSGFHYYFSISKNSFYRISPDGSIDYLFKLKFDPEYDERFYTDTRYYFAAMENGARSVDDFFIVGDVVVFGVYQIRKAPTYIFYNIHDNVFRYINVCNYTDSNISRVIPINQPIYVYDNQIVFSLTSDRILDTHKEIIAHFPNLWDNAPDYVREFDKQLLDSLSYEDNDILVFGKIKEHFD